MSTRREFLMGGCLAVAAASLPATAGPGPEPASPRLRCLHERCRHHRPDGRCALALHGPPIYGPDSLQAQLTTTQGNTP